jgi:carbon storage regulator CsrA
MLVIKRKIGEFVVISDKVVMEVRAVYENQVALVFHSKDNNSVWRGEIWSLRAPKESPLHDVIAQMRAAERE